MSTEEFAERLKERGMEDYIPEFQNAIAVCVIESWKLFRVRKRALLFLKEEQCMVCV